MILNFIIPLGTFTETTSSIFLPSKPFPIGESTEIFCLLKSASACETIAYCICTLFSRFSIVTFVNNLTLFNSVLLSCKIRAFTISLSNLANPLTKTIPTKLFNWAARKASGIYLHDFNCGIKSYKNTVVKSFELHGEMHRYIPVLIFKKNILKT